MTYWIHRLTHSKHAGNSRLQNGVRSCTAPEEITSSAN